ncbi:MAG TPA: tetratricopeptide repeat protein [Edaphobacter sp.]|nr:tetratricopeptide repeat protein [Edaphobacter sp.]
MRYSSHQCLQMAIPWFVRFARQGVVCLILGCVALAAPTAMQTAQERDKMVHDRIETNLRKIHTAGDWKATDQALGRLWLQMACDYADEEDLQHSEDAYSRAVRLFQRSSSQQDYAYALDGLGVLYLHTGRVKESENILKKSLTAYEEIHSEYGVPRVHVDLATLYLHEKRFAGAEEESAKGIAGLEGQQESYASDLIEALLASSYAKCFQGRCEDGARDADRARALAAKFRKDSLVGIATLLAVGFEQWRNGSEAEGDHSMREAVALIKENDDMPTAVLLDAQLKVLSEFAEYLRQSHQKARAQQIEDEVAQLKGGLRSDCKNCTVSVMGLTSSRK